MPVLRSYLTSLEPAIEQSICSQSIGGYCSNSLLYPETTLNTTIGLYDSSLLLDTPNNGVWTEWQDSEFVNIGNEVIKVESIENGNISVVQRGFNGIVNMHIAGDPVRLFRKELFNNVFNDDLKQYRCIAIKNESSYNPSVDQTAYNIELYIKQNSRNPRSILRVMLEIPKSQYLYGTSSSWGPMQIADNSLIGIYPDNHFNNAYLRVTSGEAAGQGRVVNSFDSDSGSFVFYNSFSSSYDYDEVVDYEVLPSPAQRVKSGTESPSSGVYTSPLFVNNDEQSGISYYTDDGSSFMVGDLMPNDIIYVWLERTLDKGAEGFEHNDSILNIRYNNGD